MNFQSYKNEIYEKEVSVFVSILVIMQPFLRRFLVLFPRVVLYLKAFECKTTSDWLSHTVYPIRRCVTFKFADLGKFVCLFGVLRRINSISVT